MTKDTHIIHRLNLEFDVPDEQTGRLLQDDALRIFSNDVLPAIEKYLDKEWAGNGSVRVAQMDIDLEQIRPEQFEDEFANMCVREFTGKIEKLLTKGLTERESEHIPHESHTPDEKQLEQFLFFIQHGRLPWWTVHDEFFPDEEKILKNPLLSMGKYKQWLVYLLTKTPHALDRLIHQFSGSFTARLLHLSIAGKEPVEGGIPPFPSATNSAGIAARREMWMQWLESLTAAYPSYGDSRDRLRKDPLPEQVGAGVKVQGEAPDQLIRDQQKAAEEGLFVNHAGLVLLHPFLERCFKRCSLLGDKLFRDEDAQAAAIYLLYYLATGKDSPSEHELVFHKYLCGMEPELPLPAKIHLSQPMLNEADDLIRSAIDHWKALKRTSPQGLREGFLDRKGKLILDDFQHHLIIEGKAIDVLLSKLPWGYGVVKLPWLKQLLIVDWNH